MEIKYKLGYLIAKKYPDSYLSEVYVTKENFKEVNEHINELIYMPMPLFETYLYRMGFKNVSNVRIFNKKTSNGEIMIIAENIKTNIFIIKIYINGIHIEDFKFVDNVGHLQDIMNRYLDSPIVIKN